MDLEAGPAPARVGGGRQWNLRNWCWGRRVDSYVSGWIQAEARFAPSLATRTSGQIRYY